MDTFRPMTLEDRELYLNCSPPNENSKFSFANGYLWQKVYKTKMCIRPEGLLFTAQYGESAPYLVSPILRPNQNIGTLMDWGRDYIIKETGRFLMKCVCPQIIKEIQAQRPGEYEFTLDRGSSEYIYKTQMLAELPGRELHQKRNHINAFLRGHSFEYLDYTPDMLEDLMNVQEQWLLGKNLTQDEETAVIRHALENYEQLGLRAAVIKTEGQIAAFSVGDMLSENAALILFEKALPQYNGLFQLINRESAARLFKDTSLINRGEDLDLPGLRKSKLSYKPEYILENFDCRLKSDLNGSENKASEI